MQKKVPKFLRITFAAMAIPFFLTACLTRDEYSPEQIQALIEEEVQKKVREFKAVKETRCQEELVKEASRIADSILVYEAYFDRDTFLRPFKPEKPEKPKIKKLVDSIPLAPLFDRRKVIGSEPDTTGK